MQVLAHSVRAHERECALFLSRAHPVLKSGSELVNTALSWTCHGWKLVGMTHQVSMLADLWPWGSGVPPPTPTPTEVQRCIRMGRSCAEEALSQRPPAGWPRGLPPGAYRTQGTEEEPSTVSGWQLGKELGDWESPQTQPKWNIRCKQSFILGGPILKLKTDKHVWEFERLTQKSRALGWTITLRPWIPPVSLF